MNRRTGLRMHGFDSRQIVIDAFVARLLDGFHRVYGSLYPEHTNALSTTAVLAMEALVNSTAPYHDYEHSIMVTMVGQEIVHGKMLREGNVSPTEWVNYLVALLCHDIGYLQGVCPGDRGNIAVINAAGDTVTVPPGMTDAYLTPYHVERGKLFVGWRFKDDRIIDCDFVCACIENTRFPVPDSGEKALESWPGLVSAADLIGQMADPDYLRKLPALFQEFAEIGANEKMGNQSPADLRRTYPAFFWNHVHHHILGGLSFLEVTLEGRKWISSLMSHVFVQEHHGRGRV